jgi:hypothetical protein
VANTNDLKDRIAAAILTVDGDMLQMALKQFFFSYLKILFMNQL